MATESSSKVSAQPSPLARTWQRLWAARADIILVLSFILITGLYALLMVRDAVPTLGLALLGACFLLYWVLSGRWFISPMGLSLLGLLALVPLSLAISVDMDLSLPKAYGLVLGIAMAVLIVLFIRRPGRVRVAIFALCLLGIGVAALGLLGTDWSAEKFLPLPQVYSKLPQILPEVPRSTSGGGIHVNILAGGLTFLVPLLVGLVWYKHADQPDEMFDHPQFDKWVYWLEKTLVLLSLILVLGTLLLTQSRGGYLGVAVGLFTLAIWKDRRFLWVLPFLWIGFFQAQQIFADGNMGEFLQLLDFNEGFTFTQRMEFWQRALYLIQDFPFTGSGMGTYGTLVNTLYPFSFTSETNISQAHNMLLSVAVDLGLPALVLYVALLSSFVCMIWLTYKSADRKTQALLRGLACGMLAYQVFGIMDALMLGSKLGIIMWIFFGLAAALYVHRGQPQPQQQAVVNKHLFPLFHKPNWGRLGRTLVYLLFGLANWAFFSIVAVIFVNNLPLLSVIVAVLGGTLLGVILTLRYEFDLHPSAKPEGNAIEPS